MRDILVQLDGGEVSPRRLDVALMLAKRWNARLCGLFLQKEIDAAALVARRPGTHFEAAAAESRKAFEEATAGVNASWQSLPHGDPGFIVSELAIAARYFDLAVVGQGAGDYPQLPDDLVERVVLESGRPVLVIPRTGAVDSLGARVAVAWNGSREASRALHDALPFMASAQEVTLIVVPRQEAAPPDQSPQVDIITHLALHGVHAKLETMRSEDIGVMDLLLSRAYDLGADLLVMGAPAGSSFGKGAGTRFLLRHLTLPVLISG